MNMKEKLLASYKNMLKEIRDKKYCLHKLEEDKTFVWKDYKRVVCKGTTTYNCSDEEMGKILFLMSKVDEAWKKGVITSKDISEVAEGVFGNDNKS